MNLTEYESKKILEAYNIPIPKGKIVKDIEDLNHIPLPHVLKAQVKYGSRKKQGLIKIARSLDESISFYRYLRDQGYQIYVEEYIKHERELYLSIFCNREDGTVTLLASKFGGVDIEEIDKKHIIRKDLNITDENSPFIFREIVRKLDLKGIIFRKVSDIFYKMYRIFVEKDCLLVEINPLGIVENDAVALDAKIILDDDAYFRQNFERKDVNYVILNGNIGCIVNGAGLAMATMDMIKMYGGEPANFLDIGGGADKERMKAAIRKVLENKNVRVLLINILGGITRCDEIARAIVECLDIITVPIVVRLRGTNEEEGISILKEAGINVYKSLDEAIKAAINLSKK